jgi:hypothetical protein
MKYKLTGFWEGGYCYEPPYEKVTYQNCEYSETILLSIEDYLIPSDSNCVLCILQLQFCHLCGEALKESGMYYSDGEYVWPGIISHHVVSHGYSLPSELLSKIKLNNFRCPKLAPSVAIEITHIMEDEYFQFESWLITESTD